MSTPDREPRDGLEAAFSRLLLELPPLVQRVVRDAMGRRVDGQSWEDSIAEAYIELGYKPTVAREKAQKILRDAPAGGWGDY